MEPRQEKKLTEEEYLRGHPRCRSKWEVEPTPEGIWALVETLYLEDEVPSGKEVTNGDTTLHL